jgi:alkylmercury lyase
MTQARIDQLTEQTVGMLQALTRADPHAARLLPALWRVLGEGRPAAVEEVAAAAGLPAALVAERLQADQQVQQDRQGRVLGFGLTLLPTRHRIDLAGRAHALYGWCAPDVLVVPWLLGVPGRIGSRCPATGTAITAHVGPEGVGEVQPTGAVVSLVSALDPADIRGSTCDRQHLFASPEAAAGWLAEHPDATVVPVAEAFLAMTRAFGRAGWTPARAQAAPAR